MLMAEQMVQALMESCKNYYAWALPMLEHPIVRPSCVVEMCKIVDSCCHRELRLTCADGSILLINEAGYMSVLATDGVFSLTRQTGDVLIDTYNKETNNEYN